MNYFLVKIFYKILFYKLCYTSNLTCYILRKIHLPMKYVNFPNSVFKYTWKKADWSIISTHYKKENTEPNSYLYGRANNFLNKFLLPACVSSNIFI
jgi:hypothetical protein